MVSLSTDDTEAGAVDLAIDEAESAEKRLRLKDVFRPGDWLLAFFGVPRGPWRNARGFRARAQLLAWPLVLLAVLTVGVVFSVFWDILTGRNALHFARTVFFFASTLLLQTSVVFTALRDHTQMFQTMASTANLGLCRWISSIWLCLGVARLVATVFVNMGNEDSPASAQGVYGAIVFIVGALPDFVFLPATFMIFLVSFSLAAEADELALAVETRSRTDPISIRRAVGSLYARLEYVGHTGSPILLTINIYVFVYLILTLISLGETGILSICIAFLLFGYTDLVWAFFWFAYANYRVGRMRQRIGNSLLRNKQTTPELTDLVFYLTLNVQPLAFFGITVNFSLALKVIYAIVAAAFLLATTVFHV